LCPYIFYQVLRTNHSSSNPRLVTWYQSRLGLGPNHNFFWSFLGRHPCRPDLPPSRLLPAAAPPCPDLPPGSLDPPPRASRPSIYATVAASSSRRPSRPPRPFRICRQAALLRHPCPDLLLIHSQDPPPVGTSPVALCPDRISLPGWFLLGSAVQDALGKPPGPSAAVQSRAHRSDCLCCCPRCVLHLHPRRIWLYLHLPWVSRSGLGQHKVISSVLIGHSFAAITIV
jgi:hypothetical protein